MSNDEWTESKIRLTVNLVEAALREQCPTCNRMPGHPCTPSTGDGMLIHSKRLEATRRPPDRVLTWQAPMGAFDEVVTIEGVGQWRARVDQSQQRAYIAVSDYMPDVRPGQHLVTEARERFLIRSADLDRFAHVLTLHIEADTGPQGGTDGAPWHFPDRLYVPDVGTFWAKINGTQVFLSPIPLTGVQPDLRPGQVIAVGSPANPRMHDHRWIIKLVVRHGTDITLTIEQERLPEVDEEDLDEAEPGTWSD